MTKLHLLYAWINFSMSKSLMRCSLNIGFIKILKLPYIYYGICELSSYSGLNNEDYSPARSSKTPPRAIHFGNSLWASGEKEFKTLFFS